jgi:hypothetical protein
MVMTKVRSTGLAAGEVMVDGKTSSIQYGKVDVWHKVKSYEFRKQADKLVVQPSDVSIVENDKEVVQ